MIFSQIDKNTLSTLTTLVKVAGENQKFVEGIITTGQHLGVPMDETKEILTDWDEDDAFELSTEEEKKHFIKECFSHLSKFNAPKSDVVLYEHVVKKLGLHALSVN